jgi:hypothetical protein
VIVPVDSVHSEYQKALPDWILCQDLCAGERTVKEKGETYLPRLSGQEDTHYRDYKNRGEFFNGFGKTVKGWGGSVFRKDPSITVPTKLEDILPTISNTGSDIYSVAVEVINLVLKYGRCGVLTDMGIEKDSVPYISVHGPTTIINWRSNYIGGKEILSMVVLRENVEEEDPKDLYSIIQKSQIRIFRLDEQHGCIFELWERGPEDNEYILIDEPIQLKKFGSPIDYIPFEFIGSESNDSSVDKPPLIDLAYINLSHWKKSVDLAHGLHYAALPTPWLAGFPEKGEYTIGPHQFIVSSEVQASAGFLEFTGKGLEAIEKALDRNGRMMAVLGAQGIEGTRDKIETAETSRLRQSGETSSLVSIVKGSSKGITKSLQHVAIWMDIPEEDIVFSLNTDFVAIQMSPQQITALMQAYQGGGISQQSFVYQMKTGEITPPGIEVEDEMELIESKEMTEFEENRE